ncbi:MAG: UTP--glucose-1-phosphate uridylyltransferase [Gammaproteobacteria bacterium]|nr:UTP--glucose-1-phosphate uridylyltransferase [Gammaproteobacteria bacterium]|tara:strand:- start:10 stop:882 length:873 start_codon:yes stop_codon:yes gene_type:complete
MKPIKKVVFPVAGLGTRFLPATKASPKEMLPIVDKPLIQYAAEEAIYAGMNHLIFVIGRTKNAIIDHFDAAPELENDLHNKKKSGLLKIIKKIVPKNVHCTFVRQDNPLGLGHAINCASEIIGNDDFAIILADDLIKSKIPTIKEMINIRKKASSNIIAIEEVDKSETDKYGIIEYSRKKQKLYKLNSITEKPSPKDAKSNLAVVGRYIFSSDILDLIEQTNPSVGGEIQITDAISKMLSKDDIYGYQFKGKRFDCGSKIGYLKANVEYALDHKEVSKEFKKYLQNLKIN